MSRATRAGRPGERAGDAPRPKSKCERWDGKRKQAGVILIATVGALTVMLILLTGILSTVAHEVKREREAEMLFRGRQIVEAIARYQLLMGRFRRRVGRRPPLVGGGMWPQSLEQLAEGITLPGSTRRVRLLRPSALRDPMTKEGEWRPVGYGDPALREFLEAYYDYIGRTIPPQVRLTYLGASVALGDEQERRPSGAGPSASEQRSTGQRRGGDQGESGEESKPRFLFGVVSRSQERPIRDYYGLERYNQWVFAYIPQLPIVAEEEKRLQMLAREIIFPSDPLIWQATPFARRGRLAPVRVLPGRRGRRILPQRRTPPSPRRP
ncbi:MAG: hypothetical protein D6723_17610 [Acidobacteria bacterium]|nr:MAG: hypothetical protein D6723_17610 [Acidobacteriota bacterium]